MCRFEVGFHGDDSPFDGRGKIVAHATLPKNGGAYIHFDEAETWTINKEGGELILRFIAEVLNMIMASQSLICCEWQSMRSDMFWA